MERIAATLFGKTRRAVLAKLYLEPARGYRLRELARLTGISPGSVQHELKQLVAADLALRSESGTQITYCANAGSPVYEELRTLIEKTSGIGELLRKALQPAARRIRLALIYGSIAKGANRARSDLDLLVVGSIAFGELVRLLAPVERRIGREVSPRLFSASEFGERLRRGDRFLKSVMQGPKIVLLGDIDDAR
jgi:predicted nucleotidyltransferase